MRNKSPDISPHSKKVLDLLSKSDKPLSAYDILDKLRPTGIKAPPTVYRALEALIERGLVHRIESINAFVACHSEHKEHNAKFAVCRACGTATEIHDPRLTSFISNLAKKLQFHIEREVLEISGLCNHCHTAA